MTQTVMLRNGIEEPEVLVKVTMMSMHDLMETNPIAVYELVSLCRDRSHPLFGNTGEVLKARALIIDSRTVHDSIRNIVVSAAEGDGLDMSLRSPVKETP
jgi:hypothetical protein